MDQSNVILRRNTIVVSGDPVSAYSNKFTFSNKSQWRNN